MLKRGKLETEMGRRVYRVGKNVKVTSLGSWVASGRQYAIGFSIASARKSSSASSCYFHHWNPGKLAGDITSLTELF